MTSSANAAGREATAEAFQGRRRDQTAAHPDPVDLCAQSDLIGAHEPMSIEAILTAPNGGKGRSAACWPVRRS
jgi:hypothetical protein